MVEFARVLNIQHWIWIAKYGSPLISDLSTTWKAGRWMFRNPSNLHNVCTSSCSQIVKH